MTLLLLALCAAVALVLAPEADGLPAFPGAEGFGAETIGGRDGRILHVTTLRGDELSGYEWDPDNDPEAGTGSVRWCLAQEYPRTIVFDVCGTIVSPPRPNQPACDFYLTEANRSYCTIAGQTAPGGGIQIAGAMLRLENNVHDVVIRHVRFRNTEDDNVQLVNNVYNVILDHCSLSWAEDEAVPMAAGVHDVIFQFCVFGETKMYKYYDPPGPEEHSMGFTIMPGVYNLSLHHNYYAGVANRNPQPMTVVPFDLVNNLLYNADVGANPFYGAGGNIVGQYFKLGPQSLPGGPAVGLNYCLFGTDELETTVIYVEDCTGVGEHGGPAYDWDQVKICGPGPNGEWGGYGICEELFRTSVRFPAPPITTWPAGRLPSTSDGLLSSDPLFGAGAFPRDSVDARLVHEYLTGTGDQGAVLVERVYEDPVPDLAWAPTPADTDHDGIPDDWEIGPGLDPNEAADGHEDNDLDGWTNIEEYFSGIPGGVPRTMFTEDCIPAPRTADAGCTSAVVLQFVVPVGEPSVESRFHLKPPGGTDVSGIFRWITPNFKMEFVPDQSLAPSTIYLYEVDSGVEKLTGGTFSWSEAYWFRTDSATSAVSPADGRVDGRSGGLSLGLSAPNPVHGSATIFYTVPRPSEVRIALYDVRGRAIATMVDAHHAAGLFRIPLDTRGLADGLYLCRMSTGAMTRTIKIVVADGP